MVTTKRVETLSSAGHRLGQVIGDWWEIQVIYPILEQVANDLGLFLDNRIVQRKCRSEKIQWADTEGNLVDYDYVLELNGSSNKKGIPVAFLESFWRRGARHSKDKARDDTNKLLPMRDTYPTARFLAIAACGEFTEPAKDYVRSRNVELFFISKEKIIESFQTIGIEIDYPDSLSEKMKADLVSKIESKFSLENKMIAAENLKNIAGKSSFTSFKQRIIGSLTATPQKIRICSLARSSPMVFESIEDAERFLNTEKPHFPNRSEIAHYEYQVSFSDGSDFARELHSLDDVRNVNNQLISLVNHFNNHY